MKQADNSYNIVHDIKILDPEEEEEQRTVEEIRRAKEKREAQQREQLGLKDEVKVDPPPAPPVIPQRKFTDILTEIYKEFQVKQLHNDEQYSKIKFELQLLPIIIDQLVK